MPKRDKCCCSCGCRRSPGSRRVECSNCGHHVCPGFCLALDELNLSTEGVRYKFSLCRQCVARDTVLPDDGIDRIICDSRADWPEFSVLDFQEMITACALYSFLACLIKNEREVNDRETHSDDWEVL